ncbi:MAG: universal stress protein [Alphaproteobacteria bacterium]|nr:universal stress protein [Alphaproteobacteria bacterium]
MPSSAARNEPAAGRRGMPFVAANNHGPRVLACVDDSTVSTRVIPHAKTIADALGGELSLLHVLEPDGLHKPFDPVEWDMRRQEAQTFVADLASRFETADRPIATKVLEGRSAEQIGECSNAAAGDITALCRSDDHAPCRIGDTARRVVEIGSGSLLLVPTGTTEVQNVAYNRVLVPLDGSARAEAALPVAVRIAASQNAELILVHATQKPHLLQSGPLNTPDVQLQQKLAGRNENTARAYLERTRDALADAGVVVRIVILRNGDARRILASAIALQSADLVVLSSHGQSGYADVAAGDVSSFLLSHAGIPVLMIRQPGTTRSNHVNSSTESKGIRRPRGHGR